MILPPPVVTDTFFSDAWNKLQRSVRGQEPIAAPGILTGHTVHGVSREAEPGPRPYGQVEAETSSPIARFRLKQIFGDYLICREWDGTTEGGTDILIARPTKLRRSIVQETIDAVTIHYSYTDHVRRSADVGLSSEKQVIVPRYLLSDDIYATKPERGTGVTVIGVEAPLEWLDLNIDGRAWSKEFA